MQQRVRRHLSQGHLLPEGFGIAYTVPAGARSAPACLPLHCAVLLRAESFCGKHTFWTVDLDFSMMEVLYEVCEIWFCNR